MRHEEIFLDILNERERQDKKYGTSNHGMEHWMTILHGETGEMANALLRWKWNLDLNFNVAKHFRENFRDEAIHAAAVLIAMIDCYDRNYGGKP